MSSSQGHHKLPTEASSDLQVDSQIENENYDISIDDNQDTQGLQSPVGGDYIPRPKITQSLGLSRKKILIILTVLVLGTSFLGVFLNRSPPDQTPDYTETTTNISSVPPEPKHEDTFKDPHPYAPYVTEKMNLNPEKSPEPLKEDVGAAHPYTAPFASFNFDNPTPVSEIKDLKIHQADFIPKLQVVCYLYDKDHLNVVIRDADKKRYELPHEYPFPYPKTPSFTELDESNFVVKIEKDPFDLVIKRKSTGEELFRLTDRLVFTNLYMEISFNIPTKEIYGFGERIGPLQYQTGTYTLFIVDRIGKYDNGKPGFNAQGHQSMYLNKEKSGLYHVNLLKNINAQEVVIHHKSRLTWKAIGGVYDFNFFLGTTPENVLQKYHAYIGGWALPAFWHMGHHQCKWWGYKNNAALEFVLEGYDKADLPLDAMWTDLEIFENDINFEFDTNRYPVKEFNNLYDKYKKRWISVVQAYVPWQKNNTCWKYPNVEDYLVKDGLTGKPLLGYEFSGYIYFFDFLNPKTEAFWDYGLDYMNDKRPLDGIWIDANEVTDLMVWFPEKKAEHYKDVEKRKYYNLPFYPGGQNFYDLHIINLDSTHYGDIEEIDVRSLSAFYQSQFTFNYLKKQPNVYFPFVLTRGNQFGNGQFGFHFIPDLKANFYSLRVAIAPILNYNIYGMPMVGADICGMGSDFRSPPELCARWYQAAVFYTFARNHHTPTKEVYNSQEPYTYEGIFFKVIKTHIQLRYALLKQMYTYFFMQPRQPNDPKLRVGTVTRPLFFEFNDDSMPAFGAKFYEESFMVYDSVLVTPVCYENVKVLNVYFPKARWFDLRFNREVPVRGLTLRISADLPEGLPYFLRGGKLLMKQRVEGIRSTADLSNSFIIMAGLDDPIIVDKTSISCSHGNILDVEDYSEETVYNKCVMDECLRNVSIYLDVSEKETVVRIQSTSAVDNILKTPVLIEEIMLLGVPKENSFISHGRFDLKGSSDSKQYSYNYDSQKSFLTISLKDPLVLSSKESSFELILNQPLN